jgi:hypothetical protein
MSYDGVDDPGLSCDAPSPDRAVRAEPPTPADPLDARRRELEALTAGDALDKSTALSVTHLFHALETIVREERAARELAAVRFELERTRLQSELDRLARRRTLDDAQLATTGGGTLPRGRR